MSLIVFVILLILISFCSCTNSNLEENIKEHIIYAERNFYYDDSDTSVIDTILSLYTISTNREVCLFDLLENRYVLLKDMDSTRMEELAIYFCENGDSLYCAVAYERLGEYIFHIKNDRFSAMKYLKKASMYSCNECDYTYARSIYTMSQLHYHTTNVIRKIELLHEALIYYERDSNYKYMGYCYCDLMLAEEDKDSVDLYVNILRSANFRNKVDSMQRVRFDVNYVKRFMEVLPLDTVLSLMLPAYSYMPTPENALILAYSYLYDGDTVNADPYIKYVREEHDKGEANYHTMQAIKASINRDYDRVFKENTLTDKYAHKAVYELYADNLNNIEKSTEKEEISKRKDQVQNDMQRVILLLIIFVLLVLVVIVSVFLYMSKKNKVLNERHEKAVKEMGQYKEFKDKVTNVIRENFLSITYSVKAERDILDRIDILSEGLASSLTNEYPELKAKDIIILFMRYIGCSNSDIVSFFGYSAASSIHHRTSSIKRMLELDMPLDEWLETTVERLSPAFARRNKVQ